MEIIEATDHIQNKSNGTIMTTLLLYFILLPCILASLLIILTVAFFRLRFFKLRRQHKASYTKSSSSSNTTTTIAFFHPNCSGGGGGERVLWKAIESLSDLNQEFLEVGGVGDGKRKDLIKKKSIHVVIYTSDPKTDDYQQVVFKHVQDRFSITLSSQSLPITFIHIPPMTLATTQRFTLIVESIHSMKLAYNALGQFTPDVYIDTTGCAFTFLVAKVLACCRVLAYVHYPTISTDMLNLVWERRPTYNNTSSISQNKIYTYIKLIYYIVFAIAYGFVGSLADIILVNSTWTYNHISYLWRFQSPLTLLLKRMSSLAAKKKKIHVVYPPCDITSLEMNGTNEHIHNKRNNCIVSIGQFRPEKDHTKQIQSYAKFISQYDDVKSTHPHLPPLQDIKLLLIGSCRNEFDYQRVEALRKLAYETLELTKDQVEFIINEPYPVLLEYMSSSLIGIHTMWNEHFGISIVEMMSNGLITIGHNSGGPKSDIITVPKTDDTEQTMQQQRTGYLAHTEDEYVKAMIEIYQLNEDEKESIRQAAKVSCERFSDEVFIHEFKHCLMEVM